MRVLSRLAIIEVKVAFMSKLVRNMWKGLRGSEELPLVSICTLVLVKQ
jgi:hypothetical protein